MALENETLRDEVMRRHDVERSLRTANEQLRAAVRDAKAKARKAGASKATTQESGFLDPEEQLRWDIRTTWVRKVSAAEKVSLPLPDYTVGPRFVASLQLEGISRGKVLEVVVETLIGRRTSGAHPLRQGEGGDAPRRTRANGAVCMRMPLQSGTPSARRLHYWKGPGAAVELSRIVLHDDMDP